MSTEKLAVVQRCWPTKPLISRQSHPVSISIFEFRHLILTLQYVSHSLQRRQAASSGISSAVIDKISVGLASTIAKFSEAKDAGAELPGLEEMSQTIGGALTSSDTNNRGQSSRAVKAALDALAEHKLAEATSGGSKYVEYTQTV